MKKSLQTYYSWLSCATVQNMYLSSYILDDTLDFTKFCIKMFLLQKTYFLLN